MNPSNTMQSQLEMSRNAHDLAGLDNLRQAAQQGDEAALKEAAQQFEAIFVQMMLKSMRTAQDAMADEDSPFNSQQVKFYRDMHDQQLAVDLASSGSMGMAELIIQQLSPNKDGFTPASVMRADGNLPDRSALSAQSTEQNPAHPPLQAAATQHTSPTKQAVFESPEAFIQSMLPIASKTAESLGLDPKALVAQAAVETGWGKHIIHDRQGNNTHNLFGIKASGDWQGASTTIDTLEFRNGLASKEKARFRSYDSFAESMLDYGRFIKESPRYQQAVNNVAEPANYFSELQRAGYATDPNYADKIMAVFRQVSESLMSSAVGVE